MHCSTDVEIVYKSEVKKIFGFISNVIKLIIINTVKNLTPLFKMFQLFMTLQFLKLKI
jgi:hypothetical protein